MGNGRAVLADAVAFFAAGRVGTVLLDDDATTGFFTVTLLEEALDDWIFALEPVLLAF